LMVICVLAELSVCSHRTNSISATADSAIPGAGQVKCAAAAPFTCICGRAAAAPFTCICGRAAAAADSSRDAEGC
jgi:hypothetical protein